MLLLAPSIHEVMPAYGLTLSLGRGAERLCHCPLQVSGVNCTPNLPCHKHVGRPGTMPQGASLPMGKQPVARPTQWMAYRKIPASCPASWSTFSSMLPQVLAPADRRRASECSRLGFASVDCECRPRSAQKLTKLAIRPSASLGAVSFIMLLDQQHWWGMPCTAMQTTQPHPPQQHVLRSAAHHLHACSTGCPDPSHILTCYLSAQSCRLPYYLRQDLTKPRRAGGAGDSLIRMCFVEVYNEEVFDLLAPARQALDVRENVAQQRFYVDGASMHVVNNTSAALELLQVGSLKMGQPAGGDAGSLLQTGCDGCDGRKAALQTCKARDWAAQEVLVVSHCTKLCQL